MHSPRKYLEKGLSLAAQGTWTVFAAAEPHPAGSVIHADLVRPPMLKSHQKTKPPLGWPRETDSLCPVCVREARQAILDGQKPVESLLNEKVGEIKATILERDGQHSDGQGLPAARPFRRRDGHRHRVLQAPRRRLPGPRHPRPQRREAAQPRQQHHQARPWLGAHRRPDQPLQHDVRPVLHGRQPGRLRPRADLGRHQAGARQRHQHQAQAADVGAVLRRRADAVAVLPRRRPLRPQGRLHLGAGGDQRHRVRQERRSSPSRRPRPGCATPTCSSTASATPPTRTAGSATCSTSSSRRSRTSTTPASTSCR